MRRVRIRQWLLLALRTIAVVCLVLAFARPTPTADAGVLEDEGARSLALVLDNSRSMSLRDAQGELLDQAKAIGSAVLEVGASGDERTVLPVARPPEYRPVPFTTAGPALDAVAATSTRSGAKTLTAAVARAASVLEGAIHPRREVVVVSDLQAATFTDSVSATLPDDVDVTLIPVGARRQVNTAVTDVEGRKPDHRAGAAGPDPGDGHALRRPAGHRRRVFGARWRARCRNRRRGRARRAGPGAVHGHAVGAGLGRGRGPHRGRRGDLGRRPLLRAPGAAAAARVGGPGRRAACGSRVTRARRRGRVRERRAQRGRRGRAC